MPHRSIYDLTMAGAPAQPCHSNKKVQHVRYATAAAADESMVETQTQQIWRCDLAQAGQTSHWLHCSGDSHLRHCSVCVGSPNRFVPKCSIFNRPDQACVCRRAHSSGTGPCSPALSSGLCWCAHQSHCDMAGTGDAHCHMCYC